MSRQLRTRATIGCIPLFVALAASPATATPPEIEALAGQVLGDLEHTDLRTVGVYDFTDLRGQVSELGRFLAEEVSSALATAAAKRGSRQIRVIDRLHLAQLVAERKLVATALVSPSEMRKAAEIAGIRGIVTARLTPSTDRIHMSVKVLDARSAEVVVAWDADLPKTPALAELETRSLTVVATPDERGTFEVRFDGPPRRSLATKDFQFDLKGCARVETVVHCLLAVSALEQDRNFSLYGGTRIVFPDGVQVRATKVRVGMSEATGTMGRAGDVLVEDVPIAASATFEDVPVGADSIHVLELELYGDDVRFMDVPIEHP